MKFTILLAILTISLAGCSGASKKKDHSGKKDKMEKAMKSGDKMSKKSGEAGKMADKAMGEAMSKADCAMKNDKRLVEVRKSGKGCQLAYSKFGNEEIVATSYSGTEHCQKIADRIVGNLENAGFSCQK